MVADRWHTCRLSLSSCNPGPKVNGVLLRLDGTHATEIATSPGALTPLSVDAVSDGSLVQVTRQVLQCGPLVLPVALLDIELTNRPDCDVHSTLAGVGRLTREWRTSVRGSERP